MPRREGGHADVRGGETWGSIPRTRSWAPVVLSEYCLLIPVSLGVGVTFKGLCDSEDTGRGRCKDDADHQFAQGRYVIGRGRKVRNGPHWGSMAMLGTLSCLRGSEIIMLHQGAVGGPGAQQSSDE
jgi:hypothetical protein